MPRKKLSEYRSKAIISQGLGIPYVGWGVSGTLDLKGVDGSDTYVIKVDQAEKRRFKKGLVELGLPKKDLAGALAKLQAKGYEHFIVEPFIKHNQSDERYL